MKPVVDEVEKQYTGRLRILRLNIHEPVGRQIGSDYGFEVTPTFIFFDQGREIWRMVGYLDEMRIAQSLENR